jgi:hypothetical protein
VNKLTRRQLELINRRMLHYPLQIAEKDYFLALAIQLVYSSALGSNLVFKGGTAIYHCYLPQKTVHWTKNHANFMVESNAQKSPLFSTFQGGISPMIYFTYINAPDLCHPITSSADETKNHNPAFYHNFAYVSICLPIK